jgi:hypothetical protein
MTQFTTGKTYKLDDIYTLFLKGGMQAEFNGDDGVFKVELIDEQGAYSDDVTSPLTTDRFKIPHFMVEHCTEVTDAS